MSQFTHNSVMLNEIIANLAIDPDKNYFDGTLGAAGHSKAILAKLKTGTLVSFDQDPEVIARISKENNSVNWQILNKNFEDIWDYCKEHDFNIDGGLVIDLGFSSIQLDDPQRGFSFNSEQRLDMRMNKEVELDAYHIVNKFPEKEIADILFNLAEERKSRQIAKAIVNSRPITTCTELATIVKSIYVKTSSRKHSFKTHPATKTFQALRIYVNRELEVLENILNFDFHYLKKGARVAVISFHSLEDRIVKNIFRKYKDEKKIKLINKKPITASEEELANNQRSRSAKLRVAEVII